MCWHSSSEQVLHTYVILKQAGCCLHVMESSQATSERARVHRASTLLSDITWSSGILNHCTKLLLCGTLSDTLHSDGRSKHAARLEKIILLHHVVFNVADVCREMLVCTAGTGGSYTIQM
jgi:hypothetical protein